MRRILVGALLVSVFMPVVAFAEPSEQEATKADLAACKAQAKDMEAILVGVAQGIQKEMELAGFRLQSTKQIAEQAKRK